MNRSLASLKLVKFYRCHYLDKQLYFTDHSNGAALVNKTVTGKTTRLAADQFSPPEEAIAVLAYRYWTEREKPIGSPEEDWFRAEREIKHNRTPGSVV